MAPPDSTLALSYGAGGRDVALLAGQAFFDVASLQGRPFRVRSGDVTVTVIGTAFGVRSSPPQLLDHVVEHGVVHEEPSVAPRRYLLRRDRPVHDATRRAIDDHALPARSRRPSSPRRWKPRPVAARLSTFHPSR